MVARVVEAGWNVKTSPSVVMIVGEVSPVGTKNVSEPMMMISLDDMTVCPAESVDVMAPPGVVVGVLEAG